MGKQAGRYQYHKTTDPFYRSREWEHLRGAALIRDKYLCQECLKEKRITIANTVHHVRPIKEFPDEALNIDNLLSVCEVCHNKLHPEKGSGKKVEQNHRARVIKIK